MKVDDTHLRSIVSIASDAIVSVDEEQCIVLFNQGAEEIFGWRAEEVLGKPLEILIPPRFRGGHGRHLERFATGDVAARRMGERQEIAGVRSSGEEFPAEASISRVEGKGGALYTVLLRDISARRRAEEAQRLLAVAGGRLAASLDPETTLRTITDVVVPELAEWCTLYVVEERGPVRRLETAHADPEREAALRDLLHLPLEAGSAHPVVRVIESGQAELLVEVTDDVLDAAVPDVAERQTLRDAGLRSAVVAPLVARGRTMGALGVFSARPGRFDADDAALVEELGRRAALALDNARLYQEVSAALAARDDVLAVVSHDLGQPLSAIRIGTSLVLKGVPAEDRGRGAWAHLEGIRQSTEQMERLIHDLLDAKRLEAGQVKLARERLPLAEALEEAARLAAPLAAEQGVALHVETEGEPVAWADADRLRQALSNLVGNALKFTRAGGNVTLRAWHAGDDLRVSVADSGKGIAEEDLPYLFERYWQAGRARRGSAGLGLSIVRGVVEAHGGTIWVESRPGQGSTFTFTLPPAPARGEQTPDGEPGNE